MGGIISGPEDCTVLGGKGTLGCDDDTFIDLGIPTAPAWGAEGNVPGVKLGCTGMDGLEPGGSIREGGEPANCIC